MHPNDVVIGNCTIHRGTKYGGLGQKNAVPERRDPYARGCRRGPIYAIERSEPEPELDYLGEWNPHAL